MLSHLISTLLTLVLILLGVAFFTLLERKALAYFQLRKGPNKVGISGLPQPLADAMKLFTKERIIPLTSNHVPFIATPVFSLFLALALWQLFPASNPSLFMVMGILFFLCVSALNVYTTLMAGWASNSKYALLGAIRAMAQTISYEVTMTLILLFYLILANSLDLYSIRFTNHFTPMALLLIPLANMWLVVILAETNRAPFDFAEGESELVSGFNVEYGGGGFTFLFIAEYANILFMSLLTSCVITGTILFSVFIAFVFLWARATLPRYRYDLLMSAAWKAFLPVSLAILTTLTPFMLLL
uniref:NADH-ubiquinone oxidoreductase chain 1 n=1 Tax=Neotrigonia margaritacea TaxID=47539 RepID=A0A1X9JRR4_9BIVA|nr:NADH dehydrogenase subunit 1 [Neotrigonia margaritacea]AQT38492.1 NADH dehydrogenase subunit 1 [Neotrigonia margaritacea]